MNIDIKNLPDSHDLLQKIIIDMHKELTLYKEKYSNLIESLRLAKQQQFASSSEKGLVQPDFFDEPGTPLTEEVADEIDDTDELQSSSRKNHPKRRPLPDYLPRETICYDINEEEKICKCGSHMEHIGEEASEQLQIIPAKVTVIRRVRPKYACKQCEENVKIAPMPNLLLPKCIATPELVAHTIISKYCDHMPLYRQTAMWRRMEIDMPRSSLCGWLLKVAELCFPLIEELKKQIVSYDYTQADESTVQVLGEMERKNTAKSYMWCYRGGGAHISIVYEYQETRAGEHAKNFLRGFKGYLQTDAYSGYNWSHDLAEIIHVGCHAHARRPFAELVKINKTPGLAAHALNFYSKLYAVEKYSRENKLTAEERQYLRLEKSVAILDNFKLWLDQHLIKTSEQGKIGKAIRYCLSHWNELTNYLKDGRIEIDNNLTENAIRPFALGRKNWLFAGSPSGAKAGATFYSLIETCKANGIDPYKYFCAMLNNIRHCRSEDDYRNLLPQFIVF